MIGTVRLSITILLAALSLLALLPFHFIAMAFGGPNAGAVAMRWHRFVLFLMGVRVIVHGAMASNRPLLLLSNHMSWLDILVLASRAPLSFIAKKEVASWPVFGWLARLQRTVFVDRERRHRIGHVADQVAGRLARGEIMVLFAEGTSSDGNTVLPFRSALIGAAHKAMDGEKSTTVQPVALAYTRMHGLPLGRQHRTKVSWFGDMNLVPHLKTVLASGAIDVQVVFGPIHELTAQSERKAVARQAGEFVKKTVARLNAGHEPAPIAGASEPQANASATPPASGGSR
ncbi:MAG: 1-acyl-sn-glycerol-3-phosphate acyltransferase [Alphaproteobacteria bacterium]|nr:MAG: 1-acyl-sn-glycerol-3-phosphate acyltransferase [Alphaproteobacteria bacterium]